MTEIEKLTFGESLNHILAEQEINKTQAAGMIGKTDAAVHRLIQDKTSPSINTALKTLEPFGYTIAIVKNGKKPASGSILLRETE